MTFALIFGTALLAAAPMYDPVVMENEYLKLTVDRQRGATLRSMIDKKNNAETAREFKSGKNWCGALAEDRLAGEVYPGAISRLHYQGNLATQGDRQILSLTCIPPENSKYKGLQFSKTYILGKGCRYLTLEWAITNTGKQAKAVTPWVHNILSGDFRNTVLPKEEGIKLIPRSADYFQDPVRDWLGAYNPDSRRFIYFLADFSKLLKHYFCYWNNYHTLEWTYQPAPLQPGQVWKTSYRIGIAEPSNIPAVVSNDAIVSYRWTDEALKLEILPVADCRFDAVKVFAGTNQIADTANVPKAKFRQTVNSPSDCTATAAKFRP